MSNGLGAGISTCSIRCAGFGSIWSMSFWISSMVISLPLAKLCWQALIIMISMLDSSLWWSFHSCSISLGDMRTMLCSLYLRVSSFRQLPPPRCMGLLLAPPNLVSTSLPLPVVLAKVPPVFECCCFYGPPAFYHHVINLFTGFAVSFHCPFIGVR